MSKQDRQAVRTAAELEQKHKFGKQFAEVMGMERRVAVVREITKKFEETVRGTLEEVIAHFKEHEPKGEFVIVVEGYDAKPKRKDRDAEDEE